MKKILSFLAMASAMVLLVAASAQAIVVLDANPVVPVTFASEIDVLPAGTTLTNAGHALDIQAAAGFVVPDGTSHYVRVNLPADTTFSAVPTGTIQDTGGFGVATLTAGGDTFSYAIFSMTPTGGQTVAVDDNFVLLCGTYDVTNKTDVDVTYAHYETAADAVNETAALATANGPIIEFATGLDITGTASANTLQIDVTLDSLQFAGPAVSTELGDLLITAAGGDQFIADGATDLTLAAAIADGTQLIVTGQFSACQNADGTYTGDALNRVFIDNDGGCDNINTAADDLDATTATFDIDDTAVVAGATLCMTAGGNAPITEGPNTGLYDVVPENGYTHADVAMTFSTLSKNGATDSLNYMLNQTSAFQGLVRITNSGTMVGDIYLNLINDAGQSARFNLVDVAGFATSSLVVGESTPYIQIQALVDAAVVALPAFATTGQYRLLVDSTCTAVVVNGFAMSKDSNVFTVIDSVDNEAN